MTVKKVEYCVSNVDNAGEVVGDFVRNEFPDLKVRRWACMGYCHRCIRVPFVLINDVDYVEGDSVDALWAEVKKLIAEDSAPDTT